MRIYLGGAEIFLMLISLKRELYDLPTFSEILGEGIVKKLGLLISDIQSYWVWCDISSAINMN